MSESIKITAAQLQDIGRTSPELVTEITQNFDAWDHANIIPGVKNKIRLTSLFIDKLVKPWKPTFDPTQDAIEFKPRELEVKRGKAELKVIPEDYRPTYLAQFMKPGVGRTPEDLPFAKYIMEEILKRIGQELNDDTAYNGVYDADGDSAIDVADGWGTQLAKMITAGEVVPMVFPSLTSSNAFTQTQILARSIPNKYLKAKLGMKMYMSFATYHKIVDELRTLKILTGNGFSATERLWFPGFDNIIEIKPVTWMGNSHRVFITPQSNLVIVADDTISDLSNINAIQQMWGTDLGIGFAIGFDFASNMIFCNDKEEYEDEEENITPPVVPNPEDEEED